MKFHSFTSLTTNSSSMIYILREGAEEEAKEILKRYNITVRGIDLLEAFICSYPHIATIIDHEVPSWKDYEPPWPKSMDSGKYEEYSTLYHEQAAKYAKDCMKIIGTQNIQWFEPHHEDNQMSDEEMDSYESISDRYGRLS